jgi:glycosyltransferase involved in cell wall biosynthesis
MRTDVGDAAALVEAIVTYATDETRRHADGERGRRLFDERYSRESSLGRLRSLVERAAEPDGDSGTPS